MKTQISNSFNVENILKAANELELDFYNSIIYKYVSLETLRKILIGNSLLFNTASSFNDPFDLYSELIDFSYNKNQFKTFVNSHKKASYLKRNARRKLIFEANGRRSKKAINLQLKEQVEKIRGTYGICCFSKIPCSTLMWSHYANNHNGACLGFKFDSPRDFHILSVRYTQEVNPENYFSFKAKALFNYFFTKSIDWKYEQEVRAINFIANGLISFDKNAVKEIYFGFNSDDKEVKSIISILDENSYSIEKKYRMAIAPKTFNLIPIDLK